MGRGPSPLTNRGEGALSLDRGPDEATLLRALARTRRRLRVRRIVWSLGRLFPLAACAALATGGLAHFATKLVWLPSLGLLAALVGVVVVAFRASVESEALLLLERASGVAGDPLRTWRWAVESGRGNEPFVRLSLARLWERPWVLDPVRAVPLSARGVRGFGLGALLSVVGAAFAAAPEAPLPSPASSAARPPSSPVFAGELEAAVARLHREVGSVEARESLERLAELAEAAERGELERTAVLGAVAAEVRRLEALEPMERRLGEELARRGESFERHAPTRGVGTAFSNRRLEEVAQALEELAARLREPRAGLDPRELEELRRALDEERLEREKRASQERDAQAREGAELEQLLDRLAAEEKKGGLSEGEARRRDAARRRVEELERRKAESAPEELDELDRQLAEAAAALRKRRTPEEAARFLERAADSAKKFSSKRLSEGEKRRLLEELRRLEERLRKRETEGAGEDPKEAFEKRAGGREAEESEAGGGTPVEIPIPGGAKPGEPGSGEPAAGGDAEGTETGAESAGAASEAGTEHDPEGLLGEPTSRPGRAEDVVAVAPESGDGPTESETIRAAGQAGFTRSAYRRLFREYETVLEEVLDRERVPRGRRAQVERYFDLIRPRVDAATPRRGEGR